MRKFSYYDSFGYPRSAGSIGLWAAKGMKDLVQHKYYDTYRRESRSYLPYADSGAAGGQFRTEAVIEGTRAYLCRLNPLRNDAHRLPPMPRRYSNKASFSFHRILEQERRRDKAQILRYIPARSFKKKPYRPTYRTQRDSTVQERRGDAPAHRNRMP